MGIFDFLFKKKALTKNKDNNNEYKYYSKEPCRRGKIYLNVPYSEKENAKALGARWDSDIKKWYYDGAISNFTKFAQWISKDSEITIALEKIYIVEKIRTCYKCGKLTRVFGLALGEHMVMYEDETGVYKSDYYEDEYDIPSLYVTWYLCERDIPPAVLEHIKSNYNVHVGKSRIGGVYFANHCEHCDAIQGSNYLMEEDIQLLHQTDEAIEKLKKHTIYSIKIEEDIPLNWSVGYSGEEYIYCKYGQIKELELSQSKSNNGITYKELYNL